MKHIRNKLFNRIKQCDIETLLFTLVFIALAVYYAIRMVNMSPWYDELYTYFYFISRGPIYSAIHWPVPNNHIGYSVLSGIIYMITHSGAISLRGISYICALTNICLIYAICRKLFTKGFSLAVVVLYSGMWLVNNLAVQGRGYTLATTMMLLCIYCMIRIALDEKAQNRFYVLWGIGLSLGLYTVSSSLYWVIPVCTCAGICLLVVKKNRELIKLILFSIAAAIVTFFLYLVVWLAIGSNLLIDEISQYAGLSHVNLIVHHPFESAARGIDYMLASPYIQSVSRQGYFEAFCEHWNNVFGQLYGYNYVLHIGVLISVIISVIMIISFARFTIISKKNADYSSRLDYEQSKKSQSLLISSIIVITMIVITPLVVILQSKLPYIRVFSFYAFGVSFALIYVLYILFGALKSYFVFSIPIALMAFTIAQLCSLGYNNAYGNREDSAYNIMKNSNLETYDKVYVTDCDLEYMYCYLYDKRCLSDVSDILDSNNQNVALIIGNDLTHSDYVYCWEDYYSYDTLGDELLNAILGNAKTQLRYVESNEYYSLYIR